MSWSLCVHCALLATIISLTLSVDCQVNSNGTSSSLPSSLHSFFAPSRQPIAVNFLPAQSSGVIFLSPNQTTLSTNDLANLFQILPRGEVLKNGSSSNTLVELNSNQIGNNNVVPVSASSTAADAAADEFIERVAAKAEVLSPGTASIENNTLFLSNPFASTPYQSNAETINSLIANIFGSAPGLQSLPPEELIFGALPSPNATVTRTFVENVFRDDQPLQTQPPSSLPESPLLPPVENNFQPEVESDVNVVHNNLVTLDEALKTVNEEAWGTEKNNQTVPEIVTSLPLPTTTTELPEITTEPAPPVTSRPQRRFNLGRPHFHSFFSTAPQSAPQKPADEEAVPVTVAPVAPTLSADFESNRIDTLPPWSTVNRVVRPPLRISFANNEATTAPTKPPTHSPNIAENITPIFANIRQIVTPTAAPTLPPRVFKFSKPTKLNSIIRKQKQFDRKYFKSPKLPFLTGRSHFTFELNNKKIVGSTFNSRNLELFPSSKPIFVKTQKSPESGQIKSAPPPPVSAVSDTSLKSLSHKSESPPTIVPAQSPALSLSSILPFSLGPQQSEEANTLWKSTLENIISLPNYKFYLGKKT